MQILAWAIGIFMILVVIGAIAGAGKKKTVSATSPTSAVPVATTVGRPTATSPSTSPPTTVSPTTTTPPPTTIPTPVAIPSQSFSGTSNQATRSFTVTGGLTVFKSRFKGSDNFAVELIDSTGQTKDVLFNHIGSYSGSKGQGLDAGSYLMKVTGVGSWTITVDQPRSTAGAALPQTYTGTSEAIVGPFQGADGSTRMQFHFVGSDNFAVEVLDQQGQVVEVAANEIGSYDGSTVVQTSGSQYWLNVTGDGTWKIQVGG